ncbi:ThiF family adenylyltransferase [Alteromonadaceae bacterium BrNp21-10]|nr:ThiF family adenylyltransferase [Alteromonadaceae bacterium BrNp21-10]
MKTSSRLAISKLHHEHLKHHLFPGDGLEAAAILLCSKSSASRLLVKHVRLVPYELCKERLPDRINWPGTAIEEAIDVAESENLSIILIHSHPGGMFDFSSHDDESDHQVIPCIYQAVSKSGIMHGSAIMIEDGAIRARIYKNNMSIEPVKFVTCASDDISLWSPSVLGTVQKRPMTFTSEMQQDLNNLTACIAGVSGTGSIVAEQLARMGIGKLILIDFDKTEFKNLNRILNSTIEDAKSGRLKTEMLASKILQYRDDIEIQCINSSIGCREAIMETGDADVIFCCVDSLDGRQICDRISSAFLQPLLDVGVTIPTRRTNKGEPAIADVLGRIDYVYPGSSTLLDRGVYSPEGLRKEYLKLVAPKDYDTQVAEGYIKGLVEEAPSVITLNMRAASSCVMEFIARCYPFRHEQNDKFNRLFFSIAESEEEYDRHTTSNISQDELLARGLEEPLLGMPCFHSEKVKGEAA